MTKAFYFKTRLHLVRLLTTKARNPNELLSGIRAVPASSIYYHTHRFLRQHHYLSPEPPNDFAFWLTNVLNLRELGELFAGVDTTSYRKMEDLRAAFIRILEDYTTSRGMSVECADAYKFHFMSCITFVLPTPHVARNVKEFVQILHKVSIDSLYFHIFEARMRLERDENDFSAWFKGMGRIKTAEAISRIDPYTITLEGLRKRIIEIVSGHA
jgi:hypothetical protein